MNLIDIQDNLKNLTDQQLSQEMQMPSGNAPQYLVLSELQRRKTVRERFQAMQTKAPTTTVAEDAVAAAGMPQGVASQMARSLAPNTSMAQNTGIASLTPPAQPQPERMAQGGIIRMAGGRQPAAYTDPAIIAMANRLGMSVEEYLKSMNSQGANIMAGSERRALRDRMSALEPVGDGVTFPTQGDLNRRYADTSLIDTRPMVPPAMDAPPVFPPQQARVIGGEFTPAALPALPQPDAPFQPEGDPSGIRERLRRAAQPNVEGYTAANPVRDMMAQTYETGAGEAIADWMKDKPFDPTGLDRRAQFEPTGDGMGLSYLPPEVDKEYYVRNTLAARPITETLGEAVPTLQSKEQGDADIAALKEEFDRPTPPEPQMDTGTPLSGTDLLPPAMATDAGNKIEVAPDGSVTGIGSLTGGGGSGGGGGAGAASGSVSSYEQQLLDAMARSEKRAKQDKWLALAQAGLAMMTSDDPSFLGAVGEGGGVGIKAFTEARNAGEDEKLGFQKSIYEMRMQQAAAAQRAAGAKAGAATLTPLDALKIADQYNEMMDSMVDDYGTVTAGQEQAYADLQAERDKYLAFATPAARAPIKVPPPQ